MRIAIHAITRKGQLLAMQLASRLENAEVFVLDRSGEWGGDTASKQTLKDHLSDSFSQFDQHIGIFSVGIATRLLAPLLQDKRTDPGVICVDEAGQFVVPVLSGHRGGANEIAKKVAKILKAQAVITTASDTSETLSVDMFGKPLGWHLAAESEEHITSVSSAVVNGAATLIWQQSGQKNWWIYAKRMPEHIWVSETQQQPDLSTYSAAIIISNKQHVIDTDLPHVIWRPTNIEIGIGCDRNTPLHVLQQGLAYFLEKNNLHPNSIAGVHSAELKANELGIIELAKQLKLNFHCYPAKTLAEVEGIENPSETVLRCIGISSVAEAACLHGSQRNKLLIPKFKFNADGFNMTLAACERHFNEPMLAKKRKNICGETIAISHSSHRASHGHKKEENKGLIRETKAKPIKQYAHHLFVCEGGRCQDEGAAGLAHYIRQILKSMQLSSGTRRIKVTRSYCVGACRQRATAAIYARKQQDPNHSVWLQSLELLTEEKWRQVLQAIADSAPLNELLDTDFIAEVEACN
ncbi:cobalamin biosynthesis protein [Shewanella livingstonensis]|uniref:Cobalamin biosynthesis protein CbiG n=1 Tax=Shewanella livingstonensis TaxID=150120 RepID=A0A3G8LWQ0_9GAMM|nr:cobalamin biosynthesis protein [Shewanella livingstonensis]AZG73312.1 cobalamin biosynthesis protein CbiG [Shewanella livingstonensis]